MATADIAAASLTDIKHRGQLRRAVIASTVGTTIEWYDRLLCPCADLIAEPTSYWAELPRRRKPALH